jgi:hypothetical protein
MPAERPARHTSIPLERRFVEISEPLASGEVSVDLLRWAGKTLAWSGVLARRSAVIFGEAGTGKTAEFRSRASALATAGHFAFFLPVEAVARSGVTPSLELKTAERFARWRQDPTAEGWIFLDSVDEAKLKGQALTGVLRALATELGAAVLARSHVLLSSRPSDWRSTDEEALDELAAYLVPSGGTEVARPVLLQLLPLDEAQVRALAEHFGVADLDTFLDAVRVSNAWSFLQRPLDVKWLARYWHTNGRLGGYRELVSHNVDERLGERHDRPTILSATDARDAAAKLAFAALVTRSGAFLLPGESDPRAADALEPGKLLPERSAGEIRDLLGRGLFDEATYGRVRIHHRSVTEFLASEQIQQMRAGSLSQSDVEALLFRSVAGRTVVPAHLTALAAWLAHGDDAIRRRIIACAPEILIHEADPSGLSAADRQTTLRAYAKHFADRRQVFHHLDPFGLQRFATPELSGTIHGLLSNAGESNHLRTTLLRMIEEGRIHSLVEDALICALALNTDNSVRRSAIRAIAAAGLPADRDRLVPLMRSSAAKDPEVLAALLKVLFPRYISGTEVAEALRATVRPPNTVTSLDVYAGDLAKTCDRLQLSDLLAALVAALLPPSGASEHSLNPNDVWLSEYVAEAAARAVDDGPPFPPALAGAVTLLRAVRGMPGSVSSDRVERLLDATPHLRREAFWLAVAERARGGTYPRTAFDIQFHHLSTADADWLRADCIDGATVRDRLLAFDCLARFLPEKLSHEAKVSLLRAVSEESRAKHVDDALGARFRRMLAPPWMEPHPAMLRIDRLHRLRDLQQERLREKNHAALLANLPSIREGLHAQALLHLYERCGSHGVGSRHDALFLEKIRTLYDEGLAQAAGEGFRKYWRIAELPSLEDMASNATPFSVILALVGVTLDVAAGGDLAALSEDLLVRVTTLASRELNGFPDWFASIAGARPDLGARSKLTIRK